MKTANQMADLILAEYRHALKLARLAEDIRLEQEHLLSEKLRYLIGKAKCEALDKVELKVTSWSGDFHNDLAHMSRDTRLFEVQKVNF